MTVSLIPVPINISSSAPKCRLYFWAEDGKAPVADYLVELGKSRPAEFRRLQALFERIAETGRIINAEHFKDVEGHKPLFEFKARGPRIYCFFDGSNLLILAEGDIKTSDKSKSGNKSAIERAERRADLYWQEKKAGRLEVRK